MQLIKLISLLTKSTPPFFRCFVLGDTYLSSFISHFSITKKYKIPSLAYARPCWSVATTARKVHKMHKKGGGGLSNYPFSGENFLV